MKRSKCFFCTTRNAQRATNGIRVFTLCVDRCPLRAVVLLVMLCALSLTGCVRLTGTAGYSKTGADGETTTKKATFDTADYVPGSPPPGNITV